MVSSSIPYGSSYSRCFWRRKRVFNIFGKCNLIFFNCFRVYFIMRKFFGFEAALLSGFLLIFSIRDIMVYLWGQWPERMGFAYLPLILYCFYKYCNSYLSKEEKPIYLYVMSLLLAINFLIHPMDFFHSVAALIILSTFLLIKEKGTFFSLKNLIFAVILFLFVISLFPLQSMNVVIRLQTDKETMGSEGDISRLFYWFKPQEGNQGVPQSYFSYKAMIGPYWTIPLIFLGILFLLLRRNKKDLVILAWLVSLYIMIHLDVIGKGRVHRSLSGTAHIFYPLMVLGLLYLVSLTPKIKEYKYAIKYGLIITFVVLTFMSVGIEANKSLKGAYQGISRLNPPQYELVSWIRQSNIPADSNIFHMGSISQQKSRWMWMMSQRYVMQGEEGKRVNITNYIIMDYSDFAFVGSKDMINQLQEWERQNLANNTLIYNKEYIRVYKFENRI